MIAFFSSFNPLFDAVVGRDNRPGSQHGDGRHEVEKAITHPARQVVVEGLEGGKGTNSETDAEKDRRAVVRQKAVVEAHCEVRHLCAAWSWRRGGVRCDRAS